MSARKNKLDDIPGRRIEGELFETIYNAIENTISPQDVDPLVNFYRYIEMSVQEAVKRLREDSRGEYFIAFTKLNNNKWNRLYL